MFFYNKFLSSSEGAILDSRVTVLEDNFTEEIHHPYTQVVYDQMDCTNPYTTSTFSGWGTGVGSIDRISKVIIPFKTRAAEFPVTKVKLEVWRLNETITDDDFADENQSWPYIGSKMEKLATKEIVFEEALPATTKQNIEFVLDETIDNPDGKVLIIDFEANNQIDYGYNLKTLSESPAKEGYMPGAWWNSHDNPQTTGYGNYATRMSESATGKANLSDGSGQGERGREAQGQYFLPVCQITANYDDVEKVLFDTTRVDDLEDQLYDTIEHSDEYVTQDWMKKGSAQYYSSSTFSGWLGSIGRPDKIGWVEFLIQGRGADYPITQVRCRVYKLTRDITEEDCPYTEGAEKPYSNPILGNFAVKVVDKILNFEEPITGIQTVRFELDEIIDNTEDHFQYLVGYNCNNFVSGGARVANGGDKPYETGFVGPWISYTTWSGLTTGNDFDDYVLSKTRPLNLAGNCYYNEHKDTPQYHIMEAKVGYIDNWSEHKITPDPDGKIGTVVQNVLGELGFDKALVAGELVQPATLPVYQGYSPIDLTNPASTFSFSDPASTFTGETQPIGEIPADVEIGGFRVPFKIRIRSGESDPHTATKAAVYLYECDSYCENTSDKWDVLNPVLVRSKVLDIDLDLDDETKNSGIFDFYFDESYYNTNGKVLYLGVQLGARFCRTKTAISLKNYLNNNFDAGLESVKSFYDTTYTPAAPGHSNKWQNESAFAFSIITPNHTHIASDKFNEWVDERTSGTIADEVENYLAHHELPVPANYEVRLAKKYYAVVGDKLQLFYDGLIKGINPSMVADITVRCSKGNNYPRYWEYTPTSEEAGQSFSLKLYVRNFQGKIVSQGTTTIEVLSVPTYSDSTTYNMLGFGDSLTSSGTWFGEGLRRLVGTETSGVSGPASLQVPNLSLSSYGKKHNTNNTYEVYHEGYGGWTWGSFLQTSAAGSTVNGIFVTLNHDVTWTLDDVQHSIWTDQNNKQWKLEDFEGAKIKFDRGPGNTGAQSETQLPTSLHCASKSLDITAAEIVNVTWESGNPFYDDATERVNFVAHAQELNHVPADIVSCLLTWNGGGGELDFNYQTKIATHMTNATTLLRIIHNDLPNAKIICCGIQLPSITGGAGANYGANGSYADQNATYYYAFDYNKALEELVTNTEFGQYCYYVDTKGQFDTKHLMPSNNVAVNTRSSETEPRGTNGVHPSTAGYFAIGDAYFRTLVKVLNDIHE